MPTIMLGVYLCVLAFIHVLTNSGKFAAIMALPMVAFTWIAFTLSLANFFRQLIAEDASDTIDLGISPFLGALYSIILMVIYLNGLRSNS